MIDTQIVADYLTSYFNDNEDKITFNFYAEVGKNEYKADVTGMVSTEPSKLPPANIKNGLYTFYVGLIFGISLSNSFFIKVKKIVEDKLVALNGTTIKIGKGTGFVTTTLPTTGDFKIDRGVGSSVPMTVTMTINYTEDGVLLPKSKHWLLNGQEINYISESLSVNKNGKINPINSRNYNQTLLMSQMRYYHFKLYNDTSNLCLMLQKDLLDGELNKTYTLTYFDGVNFTEDNPFETKVLIYNTGNSMTEIPSTPMFDLTFVDADDGKNEVKYQMALIDNPFDSQTENERWFASQDEQINYYLEKVALGADFDDIPAPNINSLYLTSQIYLNTRKYDIFDLINKNFAIIKATKGEITNYFYYRVLKGEIGANGQVIYDLKLNSLQTYLFNPNLEIKGTFINKAHLDRWIDNGDGTVSFNGRADSKLFEREEIRDVAKRLVYREKLKYYTDNENNKNLAGWMNDKILCWVYIYIDNKDFSIGKIGSMNQYVQTKLNLIKYIFTDPQANYFDGPTAVLAYPIFNAAYISSSPFLLINQDNPGIQCQVSPKAFELFLQQNSGEGYTSIIKAIKLSIRSPFFMENIDYDYSANPLPNSSENYGDLVEYVKTDENIGDGNILIDNNSSILQYITYYENNNNYALMYIPYDPLFYYSKFSINNISNFPKNTFSKSELINVNKNKNFNPKMNSVDYKALTLSFMGSTYDFDLQKVNNNQLVFLLKEPLLVDMTKILLTLNNSEEDNIFNKYFSEAFTGLILTNDMSLPIASNVLAEYLANNKNAYLSFQNQQNLALKMNELNMARSALSTTSAAASQAGSLNFAGAAATTAEGIGNMLIDSIQTSYQLQYNQTQFDLTIDNMRSAPNTLQNANGSAIFGAMVSDFGIYAELYEGLDTELEAANDIMFRDGYNLNRFGEIQDYIHIRKYFNYIKAVLGNISGVPMSESARADLKQRFANGVRFWTTDDIDYTKENYELWLEETEGGE